MLQPLTCVMLGGLEGPMISSEALQGDILLQLYTLCQIVKECSMLPLCAGLARS